MSSWHWQAYGHKAQLLPNQPGQYNRWQSDYCASWKAVTAAAASWTDICWLKMSCMRVGRISLMRPYQSFKGASSGESLCYQLAHKVLTVGHILETL